MWFFMMFCCIQYKFVVDGEWKLDENRPFVNSNYGTVNTLLLGNKADYLPTMSCAQVPPVASMDVDNDTFQRVVRDFQSQPVITHSFLDFHFNVELLILGVHQV